MGSLKTIAELYKSLHNSEPLLVRSPGRINLIGEHTDYNLGSVLPAAINKYIYLGIGKRSDNEIDLYASDYSDHYTTSRLTLEKAWKLWPNYILGVINEIQKDGKKISGVNIVFGGDIPLAVGLSSSAAITCATAFALNRLFKLGYSQLELAKIAQSAEHNYVGVHCGLMDQFASLFGKEGHLIKLDCKTNTHAYIPYTANDIAIVLFDSGVKHHLVSSAYNERREQCQKGLSLVKEQVPTISSLPEVTEAMLTQYVKPVDEIAYKRCLYVIQEIDRLEKVCSDMEGEDFEALGQRMFQTHAGLKELFEVSCDECDFLVDSASQDLNVLGSRMMGGGFGGCTINLIYKDAVEEVCAKLKDLYSARFNRDLKIYNATIGNGTEEIEGVLVY